MVIAILIVIVFDQNIMVVIAAVFILVSKLFTVARGHYNNSTIRRYLDF